jgi:hypothetical protein
MDSSCQLFDRVGNLILQFSAYRDSKKLSQWTEEIKKAMFLAQSKQFALILIKCLAPLT